MAAKAPVVLLIDDHPDSVEMYSLSLASEGFEHVSAGNADDGFARACECHPDVIVADLRLPGGSGLELTRRLRADPRTADAAIIILTGHIVGPVQVQAIAAGCDRFLAKPCVPDALTREIRDVLRTRLGAGQSADVVLPSQTMLGTTARIEHPRTSGRGPSTSSTLLATRSSANSDIDTISTTGRSRSSPLGQPTTEKTTAASNDVCDEELHEQRLCIEGRAQLKDAREMTDG